MNEEQASLERKKLRATFFTSCGAITLAGGGAQAIIRYVAGEDLGIGVILILAILAYIFVLMGQLMMQRDND